MIQQMQIGDTRPIIDRNYRDITLAGQWLRECKVNADEAGAKNIHFGIEWQGVESMHVYRRYIADDGSGMSAADLDRFMRTYGGGGKTIGGQHDNFGIGAKIALLPWNPSGVLVVSYQDGQGQAILLRGDEANYGAAPWPSGDTLANPNGLSLPEFGIADIGAIWQQVPFWAEAGAQPQNGTIFLLLGSNPSEDTLLGDPGHQEGDSAVFPALYLNTRLWQVPAGQKVTIDVPQNKIKGSWPRRFPGQIGPTGFGTLAGKKYLALGRRTIRGAEHYIDRAGKHPITKGTVALEGGINVHWYLREEKPEKRDNPYAPRAGFIGVLYKGELYEVARSEDSGQRYRQFGVATKEVRERLFLVLEPTLGGPQDVYPTSGRDRLLLPGGQPLPFSDWGAAFHEAMPEVIAEAVAEALAREMRADSSWKEKMFRYLPRLSRTRLRRVCDGTGETGSSDPTDYVPPASDCGPEGDAVVPLHAVGPSGPENGSSPESDESQSTESGGMPKSRKLRLNVADQKGAQKAREEKMRASIPSYRIVAADEMQHPHLLASWDPLFVSPEDGSVGCVLLNRDHIALETLIADMAREYGATKSKGTGWARIEQAAYSAVGQSLVGKVMHVQAVIGPEVSEGELAECFLSDAALTTAGLGMIGEQQMLQQSLGGMMGRKKSERAA